MKSTILIYTVFPPRQNPIIHKYSPAAGFPHPASTLLIITTYYPMVNNGSTVVSCGPWQTNLLPPMYIYFSCLHYTIHACFIQHKCYCSLDRALQKPSSAMNLHLRCSYPFHPCMEYGASACCAISPVMSTNSGPLSI